MYLLENTVVVLWESMTSFGLLIGLESFLYFKDSFSIVSKIVDIVSLAHYSILLFFCYTDC